LGSDFRPAFFLSRTDKRLLSTASTRANKHFIITLINFSMNKLYALQTAAYEAAVSYSPVKTDSTPESVLISQQHKRNKHNKHHIHNIHNKHNKHNIHNIHNIHNKHRKQQTHNNINRFLTVTLASFSH
jgi:hypothetical protein